MIRKRLLLALKLLGAALFCSMLVGIGIGVVRAATAPAPASMAPAVPTVSDGCSFDWFSYALTCS